VSAIHENYCSLKVEFEMVYCSKIAVLFIVKNDSENVRSYLAAAQ
jgi:hypothetical protein